MDKTTVVIIGADPSMYRALAAQLLLRGVVVLQEKDIYQTPVGNRRNRLITDELCSVMPIINSLPIFYNDTAVQLPADQVKGPKGPRGKWGKLS